MLLNWLQTGDEALHYGREGRGYAKVLGRMRVCIDFNAIFKRGCSPLTGGMDANAGVRVAGQGGKAGRKKSENKKKKRKSHAKGRRLRDGAQSEGFRKEPSTNT